MRIFLLLLAGLLCYAPPVFSQWQSLNGPLGDATTDLLDLGGKLLVGTGNGVYQSTDQGANWSPAGPELRGLPVAGLTRQGASVFAYIWPGQQLYRSDDNGAHWQKINFSGLPGYSFHQILGTSSALYLSFPDLYRSTDGGQTWTQLNVPGPLIYYYTRMVAQGDDLFVIAPYNGIYRSTNNGTGWTNLTAGLPKPPEIGTVANNKVIAAFYGTNGWKVFRSEDMGQIWSQDNVTFQWFIDNLSVAGANLYAVSGLSIWTSPLNGNTWTNIAVQSTAPFTANTNVNIPYRIKIFGSGGNLYATSFTGIYRSQNGGYGWSELKSGLTNMKVGDISLIGPNLFAAGTTGLYKYDTGNGLWATVSNGPQAESQVLTLSKLNGNLYAGAQNRLWTTSNQGNSWYNNAPPFIDFYTEVVNAGNDMLAGSSQGVYRSTDGGSSWGVYSEGMEYLENNILTLPFIRCLLPLGDTIFAADQTKLYRSIDHGLNWTVIDANSGADRLYWLNQEIIRLQNGIAYTTHNGGHTWMEWNIDYPSPVKCLIRDGNRWIAGTKGGILISNNNGQTWNFYGDGMPANLQINDFELQNGVLYAATEGEGVWSLALNTVAAPEPAKTADWRLYPSPMHQTAVLEYPAAPAERLTLRWIDLNGRLLREEAVQGPVATIQRGNLPSGACTVQLWRGEELLGNQQVIVE